MQPPAMFYNEYTPAQQLLMLPSDMQQEANRLMNDFDLEVSTAVELARYIADKVELAELFASTPAFQMGGGND